MELTPARGGSEEGARRSRDARWAAGCAVTGCCTVGWSEADVEGRGAGIL